MPKIQISFHADPVVVGDLCADLETYGCVYWHTTRPNFKRVSDEVESAGIDAVSLCARPGGDFLNFLVRTDLVTDVSETEARVAKAIIDWVALSEPIPDIRNL
jgi:hypothetical protein